MSTLSNELLYEKLGLNPLTEQVSQLTTVLEVLVDFNKWDEINLVCYSQGALTCRSLLGQLDKSVKVNTFVSLAGPQVGM